MRPTGYRSFRFPPADFGGARGLRVSVFPREVPLWWRMWLRCNRADIRWAAQQDSSRDTRFVTLALEHAAARRQGRVPDPEVTSLRVGQWWSRLRWLGRLYVATVFLVALIVGAAVILTLLLAAVGLVDVEVRTR
jgi:hypothetical protein